MLVLVQRVTSASVSIGGCVKSSIGSGLLVFVCGQPGDTAEKIEKLAKKVLKLRIFSDDNDRMNLSVQDIQGELLVVSQFTLAADTHSGNRPGFQGAASPEEGRRAYEHFLTTLSSLGHPAQTGEVGANMQVSLTNDGPATFWLTN